MVAEALAGRGGISYQLKFASLINIANNKWDFYLYGVRAVQVTFHHNERETMIAQ